MSAALALAGDALAAFLLVTAAAFALVGSYALAKLSTFEKRLHGPTKATTMGVGGTLAASVVALLAGGAEASLREILVAAFLFVTAPVSAHMRVRAARTLRPPR